MEEKQEGPEGKQTRKLPELRLTFVSQKKEKERILAPPKKGNQIAYRTRGHAQIVSAKDG